MSTHIHLVGNAAGNGETCRDQAAEDAPMISGRDLGRGVACPTPSKFNLEEGPQRKSPGPCPRPSMLVFGSFPLNSLCVTPADSIEGLPGKPEAPVRLTRFFQVQSLAVPLLSPRFVSDVCP